MRNLFFLYTFFICFVSCDKTYNNTSNIKVDWSKRTLKSFSNDSLQNGASYLAVYSEIYSKTEHRSHNLTATVSIRNTNTTDSVYISKATYYNTEGKAIRNYINQPVYIAPMETVEIIINENDDEGGSGANFIFNWSIPKKTNTPLFDAVMISTSGQQGLSFTTQGKQLKNYDY